MSGARKLRALGPPFDPTETHSWIEVEGKMRNLRLLLTLEDVLPQIQAVVEAAEKLRNDARGGLCDDPFNSRADKLDEVLTALDKALP